MSEDDHVARHPRGSDVNEPSAEPSMVAVLGHAFWRRAFASDAGAIGRRVAVEGIPFTVIGVAPPDFLGLGMYIEPDVTVPLTAFPKIAEHAPASLLIQPSTGVRVTGRLKPGVSIDQARASLELLWPDMKAANVRRRCREPGVTRSSRQACRSDQRRKGTRPALACASGSRSRSTSCSRSRCSCW